MPKTSLKLVKHVNLFSHNKTRSDWTVVKSRGNGILATLLLIPGCPFPSLPESLSSWRAEAKEKLLLFWARGASIPIMHYPGLLFSTQAHVSVTGRTFAAQMASLLISLPSSAPPMISLCGSQSPHLPVCSLSLAVFRLCGVTPPDSGL